MLSRSRGSPIVVQFTQQATLAHQGKSVPVLLAVVFNSVAPQRDRSN